MEEILTVKQVRLLMGLTQSEMSKRLDMKTATYINKEKGLSSWKVQEAAKISKISGRPASLIKFM